MNQSEFLDHVAKCLESAGISYMVAGSHGSSYHGQPRATNDIDVIIDPSPEQLHAFLKLVSVINYVSTEAAKEALSRRTMFNVINLSEGLKADLIVRKDRPFSVEEFRRRQIGTIGGRQVPIATPEDVILTKLEWDKITHSERQLTDALQVTIAQWESLDQPYLRKWAIELGVLETLEELLGKAEETYLNRPR
jgi:hypothetical protein